MLNMWHLTRMQDLCMTEDEKKKKKKEKDQENVYLEKAREFMQFDAI